jgi:ketosteroid isomerase-like protein
VSTKAQAVQAMEQAAFVGDWDKFKSFLSDDVQYRCGNDAEVTGPQAVASFLITMLTKRLALNNLEVRAVWETEDAVVSEFNSQGLRIKDNKNVTFPCLDIYRFRDGKIWNWRVFPIEPTLVH